MAGFPPPYLPTDELVAVAWLSRRVPEFIGKGIVATALPKDPTAWADYGFVQVTLVGERVDLYTEIRRPMLQLDFWAASPSSAKPPWHKANQLGEYVRRALEDQRYGGNLIIPGDYYPARVLGAYLASGLRRVAGDESGYARFTADLSIDWTVIAPEHEETAA